MIGWARRGCGLALAGNRVYFTATRARQTPGTQRRTSATASKKVPLRAKRSGQSASKTSKKKAKQRVKCYRASRKKRQEVNLVGSNRAGLLLGRVRTNDPPPRLSRSSKWRTSPTRGSFTLTPPSGPTDESKDLFGKYIPIVASPVLVEDLQLHHDSRRRRIAKRYCSARRYI